MDEGKTKEWHGEFKWICPGFPLHNFHYFQGPGIGQNVRLEKVGEKTGEEAACRVVDPEREANPAADQFALCGQFGVCLRDKGCPLLGVDTDEWRFLHIAIKCLQFHSLPPSLRRSKIPSVHTFPGRI
jgi:hypothetical protein